MTDALPSLVKRTAELRSAFDRTFAAPVRADKAAKHDLLAVRVGTDPCAIRLSEVSGLFVDRRITRVPASDAALIGIAGFRGEIVPVYSLLTLLGISGTQTPRWLVVAAGAPIALAFDHFDGHLRVPEAAVVPHQSGEQARGFAPDFIRSEDVVRPVVHLASVIAALGQPGLNAAAS